jgi:serine/threonine protein kinase
MNELNIIHRNLKLSNILISLNKINKISFKLCDFGISKNMKDELTINLLENNLTIAPEIIEKGNINNKNDIWSLGIIIYYLLFKEYPYKGESEILLYNDIISGKELKKSNNIELNDLLNKMICIDLNKRISWNDYFNHSFFKYNNNIIKYPKFEFNCNIHNKIIEGYCKDCKINICEECLNNHINHNIIDLNKIGMSDEEILKTDELIKEIEINMKKMNKIKEDIISFLNTIKLNKDILDDDNNNLKKYYIEYLGIIKEKLKIEENIIMIDLNKSLGGLELIEIEL